MKKAGLRSCIYDFFVDYRTFDISNINKIHKYLMKKHGIEQCLDFLKKLLDY